MEEQAMLNRLAVAFVTIVFLFGPIRTDAATILTFSESGNDVIASLSGSVDLSGATYSNIGSGYNYSFVYPSIAFVSSDDGISSTLYYFDIVGPTQLGLGGVTLSDSDTVDR
jgi:hypothetical protein